MAYRIRKGNIEKTCIWKTLSLQHALHLHHTQTHTHSHFVLHALAIIYPVSAGNREFIDFLHSISSKHPLCAWPYECRVRNCRFFAQSFPNEAVWLWDRWRWVPSIHMHSHSSTQKVRKNISFWSAPIANSLKLVGSWLCGVDNAQFA